MKKNEMNVFGKMFVFVLILVLVVLSFSFVVGLYFFGFVGFFELFNVKYESLGSLGLYLLFFFIFGLITEIVAKAFILAITHLLGNHAMFWKIFIETLFVWLALFTVDEMMLSINVPIGTEILLALIITLADIVFDGKKKKRKSNRKKVS